MTIKRKSSGSFTDITTRISRRLSGAWVDIDTIRRKASGAWTIAWKRIFLTNQTITHEPGSGSEEAIAGYRLNSSGIAEARTGASYSMLETWIAVGSASSYECRATITSGSLTTGTTGTWLPLSSSREWILQQNLVGPIICTFTIEIRNAVTHYVAATATINLIADTT